ncbi:MAG TPA: LamG-like jellyroll fold domain-containing protein, partial [Ramlibacter sp.]|nr:LamG-like jellyroll fold domain-containing protein [Ramlibacter sp.]
ADPAPLLRIAGIDLITVPSSQVPTLKPADARFQVAADENYVSCFRQSELGTLLIDRFILIESEAIDRADEATRRPQASWLLKRATEVRYRRSGLRDVPAGPEDSLGAQNMTGQPFFEPTTELSLFAKIKSGAFAVALGPAGNGVTFLWHLFAISEATGQLQYASFPSDASGRLQVLPGQAVTAVTAVTLQAVGPVALQATGGVSATLYQEQEQALGANSAPLILHRAQRLAVALTVQPAASSTNTSPGLAIYDFMIQTDGSLPVLPANATFCTATDGELNADGSFAAGGIGPFSLPDPMVIGDATVYAQFLGQPQPQSGVTLFAGGDGLVRAYYQGPGPNRTFQVAQYSPVMTRASVAIGTALALVASRAGSTLASLTATVGDVGGAADLCTLFIDYGATSGIGTESWTGLPRAVTQLAAILNGEASANPSDPAVISGARPFFDYGGTLRQARLPLTGPGFLTLVGHRPDLPLAQVAVGVSGDNRTVTLTIAFTGPASSPSIVQTWAGLPTDAAILSTILAGRAAQTAYAYQPGTSDTRAVGLRTESGTVLFFLAGDDAPTITVTRASSGDLMACNVTIGSLPLLPDIPRAQDLFVAKVMASAGINACFVCGSVDPVPGLVVDQTVAATLDLRALTILFDLISTSGQILANQQVPAQILQRHSLDPQRQPMPSRALALRGAMTRPAGGPVPTVTDGRYAVATPPVDGAWIPAPITQAVDSNGQSCVTWDLSRDHARVLAPGREWTIEAWITPATTGMSTTGDGSTTLVSYNNRSDEPVAGQVQPSYFVGTFAAPTLGFGQSTLPVSITGNTSPQTFIKIDAAKAVTDRVIYQQSMRPFTIEAWVSPADPPAAQGWGGTVFDMDWLDSGASWSLFQLAIQASGTPFLQWWTTNSQVSTLVAPSSTIPTGAWSHLAVVVAPSKNFEFTATLYVNGVAVVSQTG